VHYLKKESNVSPRENQMNAVGIMADNFTPLTVFLGSYK
jgi:hypothetical protein